MTTAEKLITRLGFAWAIPQLGWLADDWKDIHDRLQSTYTEAQADSFVKEELDLALNQFEGPLN